MDAPRLLAAALALSLWAPPAAAADSLAVLDVANKVKGPDRDAIDGGYLADVVRAGALETGAGLKVMTRENMLVLLSASGKALADCEGECEVETGRRLGADYIVSGEILKFGKLYKVSLRLHATKAGDLLSGAQASGTSLEELDAALGAAVHRLLQPLSRGQAAPPPAAQALITPAPASAPAAAAAAGAPALNPAWPPRAQALGRSCLGGERSDCMRVARMVDNGNDGVTKDTVASTPWFEKACALGDGDGCHDGGYNWREGDAGAIDKRRAAGLFERGCTLSSGSACTALGAFTERGEGGLSIDLSKALTLYERGCTLRSRNGCNNAGVMYREGQATPRDPERARARFQQSCDLGYQPACEAAGKLGGAVAAAPAPAPAPPPPAAIAIPSSWPVRAQALGRSCLQGDAEDCMSVARMADNGKDDVPKDTVRSTVWFEKACELGNGDGCHDAGYNYREGDAGVKDLPRARRLFERGSELRSSAACAALGRFYEMGQGGLPKDAALALSWYEKGCELGGKVACNNAGIAIRDGWTGSPDRARGVQRFEKACKLGHQPACDRLKEMGR